MVMMTMMKSEGFRWVSSAAAVYSMAITSSAGQHSYTTSSTCKQEEKDATTTAPSQPTTAAAVQGASASSRFVPTFDGLRFIETLVTAHR